VERYDVVIIGSGAGGAPVAHRIVNSKPNARVLVIDKGPLLYTQYQAPDGLSDFKRDELFATGPEKIIKQRNMANDGQSYYNSHVEPDINDEPHIYRGADGRDRVTIEGYTAQVVGGGTQIYGGVSLRFTPTDLRLKSFNEGRRDLRGDPNGDIQREARDWPISYDELEPFYCQAEELIGISGTHEGQGKTFSRSTYQTPLDPNPISRYVEVGLDALKYPRYRTPLAIITSDHEPSGRRGYDLKTKLNNPRTGYVNRYGCPLGLKSSTWASLLWPIKDRPNFTLRANTVVTHLACKGKDVTTVHVRDEAGRTDTVEAKYVVVACSAIESVRLLMLSAEADGEFSRRIHQNDLLGKYFLTHCFGGAEAVMPDTFDKSLSVDSDWATDVFASEDFVKSNGLWAGGAVYNNTSDQALPISLARTHGSQDLDTIWKAFVEDSSICGDRMVEWQRENFGRRLSVSFMANQLPLKSNRIELHPTVTDKWGRRSAHIIKDWHSHDRMLMDTLAEQCRRILQFSDGKGNYPVSEFGAVYMAENGIARIANHILGGARFGDDPKDSVLDRWCRAWEFDNLYVTDGSFMPTAGGANPTLTIEANAFRVGSHLAERLS
jgi:choline dehydrogenase-like flavoprotein